MFSIDTRVRYQETDKGGRVYHSQYLVWLDMARTEYLRDRGLDYAQLEEEGYFLVVKKVTVDYLNSAVYDQLVTINIDSIQARGIRLDFFYTIRDNKNETDILKAFTQLVCVDRAGKPRKTPDKLREIIKLSV